MIRIAVEKHEWHHLDAFVPYARPARRWNPIQIGVSNFLYYKSSPALLPLKSQVKVCNCKMRYFYEVPLERPQGSEDSIAANSSIV